MREEFVCACFSGKLFDFNEDGKVDFGESVFGISSIGALLAAATEGKEANNFDEQEALLDDMIAALEDMEANMPDNPDSWVYAR